MLECGMKSIPARILLSLVLVILAGLFASAQTVRKPSDDARRQFIKDFRRTGLNTTPGDADLLRILVAAAGSQRGVEVGSATGFGAINMGLAFERNGGHLFTLDIDPGMIRATRENVARMGLENTVTAVEGDALVTLTELTGEFDFVFLDALKQDYLKYLKLIEPRLKPGALVVADNVIRSARQMQDYLEYVQTSPDYDTTIVRASMEKNDGMAISYKLR
jgi:predicted O-methyltransferase YrrM